MRTNKKNQHAYSRLKRKIFGRALLITACATFSVLLFRWLSFGHLANGIVDWLMRTFLVDYYRAQEFYQKIVPGNMDVIIGITIIVFMLLLFRMLFSTYTQYFDEVVEGIDQLERVDQLMTSNLARIALSPELEFVEQKLNKVKHTLERRALEAQQYEQQKNDLVLYLAHDIKTPLTSVIGYLSLLDEAQDIAQAQRSKYTHIALEKANRLETLVNEFFEITRYNLSNVPLTLKTIDLGYMMVQIVDELYPQLAALGKTVQMNIGDEISVVGDSEKLARVFNNILKNAIAYSEDGGLIEISAEEIAGQTIIRFRNAGTIPEDKLESVFDKFNRLNAARSSSTGGSGLGLAIARDIVRLHGGEISVKSAGGYTVFTVALPDALAPS